MFRSTFVPAGLLEVASFAAGGCRSCSSCHDYDSPVANCQSGSCGSCCAGGSCNGACNCGGERSTGAYDQSTQVAPANTLPANAMKQQNTQPRATQQTQPLPSGYPQQ